MNNQQLDKILRKARVPKRSKQYEAEFPKKVTAAIRELENVPQPKVVPASERILRKPRI
jgi:hypothetical protein